MREKPPASTASAKAGTANAGPMRFSVPAFAAAHPDRAGFVQSLGLRRYLSAMDCAALGLGNIIENFDLLQHLGRTSFLKQG